MSKIYTVEGNTSGGSTLVANGGIVAKKSYDVNYSRIAVVWRPKYVTGEIEKIIAEALKWVGYMEKKTNANLEDFKKNAGYNNFTYFGDWLKKNIGAPYANGVAWCDMYLDYVFIQALGVTRAKQLLGGWSAYTPTSSNNLKKSGATQVAPKDSKAGDIVFFKNSTRICHIALSLGTDVEEIVSVPTVYSQKQFIKDVCAITQTTTAEGALKRTITLSSTRNRNNGLVLPVQKYLKVLGMYTGTPDKDFGTLTTDAVNLYQLTILHYSGNDIDGEITAKKKMWQSMLGLI